MSTKNSSDDEQLSAIAQKREKKLQKKIKQKDTDETVENVEENVEEKPVKNERKKRPLTDRQRAALAAGRKVRQEKQAALKKLRLQLQSEAKKGVREYVKKGIKQHQLNELISDERIKLPGEEETEEEIDERILATAKVRPTKIKKSKQKVMKIEESSDESENEETAESESESDESENEETENESESSESEVEEPPKVLKKKRKLTSTSRSRRRIPTSTSPDVRINQNELNQRKNSKKNQKTKRTRKQSRVVEYDTESSEFSSSSGGNAEPDESEVLRAWGF